MADAARAPVAILVGIWPWRVQRVHAAWVNTVALRRYSPAQLAIGDAPAVARPVAQPSFLTARDDD